MSRRRKSRSMNDTSALPAAIPLRNHDRRLKDRPLDGCVERAAPPAGRSNPGSQGGGPSDAPTVLARSGMSCIGLAECACPRKAAERRRVLKARPVRMRPPLGCSARVACGPIIARIPGPMPLMPRSLCLFTAGGDGLRSARAETPYRERRAGRQQSVAVRRPRRFRIPRLAPRC
jgi:hypothetical protein